MDDKKNFYKPEDGKIIKLMIGNKEIPLSIYHVQPTNKERFLNLEKGSNIITMSLAMRAKQNLN